MSATEAIEVVKWGYEISLTHRDAATSKPKWDQVINQKAEGKGIWHRGSSQIAERNSGLAKRKHSESGLLGIQR